MCFLEHVFGQETLSKGVADHRSSSMIKMSVGAHSFSGVWLL